MSGAEIDELVVAYCNADRTHDGYGQECGIIAVAMAVLANVEHWRKTFGVGPIAPKVAGYNLRYTDHQHGATRLYHNPVPPTARGSILEPRTPYGMPTRQAVAGNLSYGPPRSLEERLERASLSGAEGQE